MSRRKRVRDRRWTPEQARAVLEEMGRRGISVNQFATEKGLGVERLYRWRRRLDRVSAGPSTRPTFTEVSIRPSVSAAQIEIELPGGIALRLGGESRVEDAVAIISRLR